MIELKLTPEHFSEFLKKGYNLDIVFLLKLLEQEYVIEECVPSSPKISAIIQSIVRKGLATEEGKLTIEGKELLEFMSSKGKVIKKKTKTDDFDKFWKEFPGTDTFTVNGRQFKGSRALKTKKEDCKIKLNKILSEGEYTIDDIVNALKLEIEQKVENSIKTSQNKMSYFQNSLTWLNQRSFEPFIELIKYGYKTKNQKEETGVDI